MNRKRQYLYTGIVLISGILNSKRGDTHNHRWKKNNNKIGRGSAGSPRKNTGKSQFKWHKSDHKVCSGKI